jgi:hypothetical protein
VQQRSVLHLIRKLFGSRKMDYTPDKAAQAAKQKDIETLLVTFGEDHTALDPEQAKQLIDSFVTISPPLNPPLLMELTVMSNLGRGGGKSRKPGNIRLNWRRLFELVPDVTLAGAGAATAHWLIPFAALYVWMKLWNAATVNIEEEDAFFLYSLWLHRNDESRISEDEAFSKTESLIKNHGLPLIKRETFDQAINKLRSLECIELDGGVIWLREWVIIKY